MRKNVGYEYLKNIDEKETVVLDFKEKDIKNEEFTRLHKWKLS